MTDDELESINNGRSGIKNSGEITNNNIKTDSDTLTSTSPEDKTSYYTSLITKEGGMEIGLSTTTSLTGNIDDIKTTTFTTSYPKLKDHTVVKEHDIEKENDIVTTKSHQDTTSLYSIDNPKESTTLDESIATESTTSVNDQGIDLTATSIAEGFDEKENEIITESSINDLDHEAGSRNTSSTRQSEESEHIAKDQESSKEIEFEIFSGEILKKVKKPRSCDHDIIGVSSKPSPELDCRHAQGAKKWTTNRMFNSYQECSKNQRVIRKCPPNAVFWNTLQCCVNIMDFPCESNCLEPVKRCV